MKNWVDVIFVLASLVSFIRGYRAGFITSIFSFLGYIGGGLLGLTLGLHYFHSRGVTKFFLLFLAASLALAIYAALGTRWGWISMSIQLLGLLFLSQKSALDVEVTDTHLQVGKAQIERKFLGKIEVLSSEEMRRWQIGRAHV